MKPYKFSTLKDKLQIGGLLALGLMAVSSVALFAAGPVGLVVTTLAAGGMTAYEVKRLRGYRVAEPLPQNSWPFKILQQMAQRAGLKKIPHAGFSDEVSFAGVGLAPGGGTIFRMSHQSFRDSQHDKAMIRFVIAHEVSHLRTEVRRDQEFVLQLMKNISAVSPVTLLFAGSLPAMMMGAAIFGGARLLRNLIVAKTCRMREVRADRNALYLTRDLQGAFHTMRKAAHSFRHAPKPTLRERLFLAYPTHIEREDAMRKSFRMVSRYPASTSSPCKLPKDPGAALS